MNKGHFILDLDQTIISAEPVEEYNFASNKAKSKKFKFHDMDGYYIVFERPGLQDFLDYLFANFQVSVWTAASKDYAIYILNNIILAKPERKINYVFYSYHCDISKKKMKGTKTLAMLWEVYGIPGFTENNTVILDDYDEVQNTQKENCLIAPPFEFQKTGSENDDFLKRLQPLLTELPKVVDKPEFRAKIKEINQTLNKA
jgi:TFIIF-interacting CTD phosphatase-like protein